MTIHFSHRRAYFEALEEFDPFPPRKPCWIHWYNNKLLGAVVWAMAFSSPFWLMLVLAAKGLIQ